VLGSARLVLVPSTVVADAVSSAAKATFFDLGVANTRGRTGVLVFVALEERRIEVVADSGVLTAVDRAQWNARVMATAAVPEHAGMADQGVEALAQAIEGLAPALRHTLPRREDDVDELEEMA
jgi:putative membrane protein